MLTNSHYCTEHQCQFYRNEKNGRVWYSHKIRDSDPARYHNENTTPDEDFIDTPLPNEKIIPDERSRRIERQHQTEMAIRSLELLFKVDPEKLAGMVADKGIIKLIKEMTDLFVKDLNETD